MDPILGQISFFAFNFEQNGWLRCMGQILNISQNNALFSLLNVNFGGNGTTTFGLPDLRGKVIMGQGAQDFNFASSGGYAATTLTQSNLPTHTHTAALTLTNATTTVSANTTPGTTNSPSSRANCIGTLTSDKGTMYNNTAPSVALNVGGNTVGGSVVVSPYVGQNLPFSNMPPYCVLNAAIATEGVYPQRS